MKIGILTFHWSNNYGAVIQAYALRHYLQSIGAECEIIPYQPKRRIFWRYIGRNVRQTLLKIFNNYKSLRFLSFRNKVLSIRAFNFASPWKVLQISKELDLVIIGSDQVWNYQLLSDIDLSVYLGLYSTCRVASYAASSGQLNLAESEQYKDYIYKIGLRSMSGVSVREETTAHFITKWMRSDSKNIKTVLDPVFLLPEDDYSRIMRPEKVNDKPYGFAYILHDDYKNNIDGIKSIRKDKGLELVGCDNSFETLIGSRILPGPEKWLRLIRDSSIVFTNSFHCICFCIIFRKLFIPLELPDRLSGQRGRVDDLMNTLFTDFDYKSWKEKVLKDEHVPDWDNLNIKLKGMKKQSYHYIESIVATAK